jgi:hypothetical protein
MHRAIMLLVLVLPAGLCAAAIPDDVPAQKAFHKQLVEVFQDRLLSQSKIAGTNWEAAGRQLARLTAESMALDYTGPLVAPTVDQSELAALADALLEIGCDDPAMLFCCMRAYTRNWREADARKLAPALSNIKNRQLPALIVYFLNTELAAVATERSEWQRIQQARTTALFAVVSATRRWLLNPGQLRLVLKMVESDAPRYPNLQRGNRLMEQAAKLPNTHPWLVAMLKARVEQNLIDEDRADEKLSLEHASSAKRLYEEAAELQPAAPEPLVGLIDVADVLGEPVMPLIERALYTEVDNPDIWDAIQSALQPAEGGDYAPMMQVAALAADTKRYDTLAPLQYARFAEIMASDPSFPQYDPIGAPGWPDDAITQRVMDILQHYIDASDPASDRAWRFKNWKVIDAWRARHFDLVQQLKDYPRGFPAPGKPVIATSWEWHVPMSFLFKGEYETEVSAMLNAARGGDYALAMKRLEALETKVPADLPGVPWLRYIKAFYAGMEAYEAGKEVSLLPDSDGLGWNGFTGDWKLVDGALSGATGVERLEGSAMLSIDGPVEISMDLSFPAPSCEFLSGLNVIIGKPGGNSVGVHLVPIRGEIFADANDLILPMFELPAATEMKLSFIVDETRLKIRVGDQVRSIGFNPMLMADALNSSNLTIQQSDYGSYPTPRMRVIIKSLTAKKLPPGAAATSQPLTGDAGS